MRRLILICSIALFFCPIGIFFLFGPLPPKAIIKTGLFMPVIMGFIGLIILASTKKKGKEK